MRKITLFFAPILFCTVLVSACDVAVNKTVYVEDGEKRNGSINSVNGSIIIGKNCTVRGDCRTVNGRIEVGSDSRVGELQSVNGGIEIDRDANIRGDIESVNGSVFCDGGVEVRGQVKTINGKIRLNQTVVERNLKTINGDITLAKETKIKGDIIVESKTSRPRLQDRLVIKIANNSTVEGDIIVEDRNRQVEVYLIDGGKVLGNIENAEIFHES